MSTITNPDHLLRRGIANMKMGNIEAAFRDVSLLMEIEPGHPSGRKLLDKLFQSALKARDQQGRGVHYTISLGVHMNLNPARDLVFPHDF